MHHTLSVALCTFNGERFLGEQLESICQQTRLPDEVVICDDTSSDHTHALLSHFRTVAPFTVRLHRNDTTLGSTRNFSKAVDLCRGDIIVFCDQDDVWHPEKLAHIEHSFLSDQLTGLVLSDANIVDENLNPLGYTLWESTRFTPALRQAVMDGRALEVMLRRNIFYGNTMAFRSRYKGIIQPMLWGHDAWTAMLVASLSTVTLIETPLLKYRQHSGQQVSRRAIRKALPHTLRKPHSELGDLLSSEIAIFKHMHHRLATNSLGYSQAAVTSASALMADKIRHLERRLTLPRTFWKRARAVFLELTKSGYHTYSNGLSSAIRDLLRPAQLSRKSIHHSHTGELGR